MKRLLWAVALCLVCFSAGAVYGQPLDYLTTRTFPVGTVVVPMDDKQPIGPEVVPPLLPNSPRLHAFGFMYALNAAGITYYRVIQPPDTTTLYTTDNPGGATFLGGPFFILPADAAAAEAIRDAGFSDVVTETMTASYKSDMVLISKIAPRILVLKSPEDYGQIQYELRAMKIPEIVNPTDRGFKLIDDAFVAFDPTLMDGYDIIVDDCEGWYFNGAGGRQSLMPDKVVNKIRTLVYDEAVSIKFTDRALLDLDKVFPNKITWTVNVNGVKEFEVHRDPYTPGKGESRSQYFGAAKPMVFTLVDGIIMTGVGDSSVRNLLDSDDYGGPGIYRIGAVYFPYGKGLVEGFTYHFGDQYRGSPSPPPWADQISIVSLFGNNFVHRPPQIPPPACDSFTATPATIDWGQSSTLAWQTRNATAAADKTLLPAPNPPAPAWNLQGDNGSGSTGPLTGTTTYTLTLSTDSGTAECQTTVTVNPPSPPQCQSFAANPAAINQGSSSTLSWTTLYAASATMSPNPPPNPSIDLNTLPNGNGSTGPLNITTTYTLTVLNLHGTNFCQATVTVWPPPACDSFTATPGTIVNGSQSKLEWVVSNTASATITANPPPDPAFPITVPTGSGFVAPTATTTYTLNLTGPVGGQGQCQVTVTVVPYPPPRCLTFTATPNKIYKGESSTLAWTSENATTAWINPGVGFVPVNGNKLVSPTDTTTYRLNLEGPGGITYCEAPVTVEERPPCVDCLMTGGGKIFGLFEPAKSTHDFRFVDYGIYLHCDPADHPNTLTVHWWDTYWWGTQRNRFVLKNLTSANCFDDPSFQKGNPDAGFNTYVGAGTGTVNYMPGYRAEWVLTDAGSAQHGDTIDVTIYGPGDVVLLKAQDVLVAGGNAAYGK